MPLIAQIVGRVTHASKETRVYYAPMTVLFFNWTSYVSGFIADRKAFNFMVGLAAVLAIFHIQQSQK